MGQHASLRVSRRSGGVDEGRNVLGLGNVSTGLDILVGHFGALKDEFVDVAVVKLPDDTDPRSFRANLIETHVLLGGVDNEADRTRVGEDVRDLAGGGRFVDGDEDTACVEHREVD